MNCGYKKEMRDRLPEYGAVAGAGLAMFLIYKRKFPNWNPVSAFAESMTVGYLGGFLLAPILFKKCSPEAAAAEAAIERDAELLGLDDVSSVTGGYAGYGLLGPRELPEGCADWSGVCESEAVYNTIDGSKCPQSRATLASMWSAMYSCPEWYSEAPIRKGPRPVPSRPAPARPHRPRPVPGLPLEAQAPVPAKEPVPQWVWALAGAALAVGVMK